MSSPFSNVPYIVKKKSDGSPVGSGVTNVQGEYVLNLPPGIYTVSITPMAGHTLDNNIIAVPGETEVECEGVLGGGLLVLEEDVTVIEEAVTVVTSEFIIN